MHATLGNSLNRLGTGAVLIGSIVASAMAGGGSAPELEVGWTVDGNAAGGTLTGSGLGAGVGLWVSGHGPYHARTSEGCQAIRQPV